MTSNEILHAEILDILFDNRNKQYGAYTLRKNYNQRLILALAGALSTIFLLMLLVRPGQSTGYLKPEVPDLIVKQVTIPPDKVNIEPVRPKPTEPSSKKMATEQFTRVRIVAQTNNTLADVNDLSNKIIDVQTADGGRSRFNEVPDIPLQGNGDGGKIEKIETIAPPMIQAEPEFPGGIRAWLKFLNRNLIVPDELEADEKKLVRIRFQVAADGSVTNFEIVQSAGAMYDNEVIRVLKKMPKWKPAIQNNQPVARYFTQPVTFMGL